MDQDEPSQSAWQRAPEPNYGRNEYLDFDETVLLNRKTIKSHVLDFWGEGRTEGGGVQTGFRNSYNVNHRYQLVSNPPDAGRKIPNCIPVASYDNPDISRFVQDDTFQFVTIMGSPLVEKAAQEITRVVCRNRGFIILYGATEPHELTMLERNLANVNFGLDKFTSMLVTRISELESICIPNHPRDTRVYSSSNWQRLVKVSTVAKSPWQQSVEKETDGNGCSEFVADDGCVLVGCRGDENGGSCYYKTGKIQMKNSVVSAICKVVDVSDWVRAGSESYGESMFECPLGAVLVGQKYGHGETWYKFGWLRLTRGQGKCETCNVSDWVSVGNKESGKGNGHTCFECRNGKVLVGRKHKGDAHGETWYKYAKVAFVDGN